MALPIEELPVRDLPRRLREPQRGGAAEHFGPTDPHLDLARLPLLRRALQSRRFQFFLILPNQLIFWLVIVTGLFGALLPTHNFSTVITWYIWFCAVFLLMAGVGRGWCAMCPFGGLAEWVQRRTLWTRHPGSIGLGRRWPRALARFGILPSVAMFLALTWFEEFLNIAGPGDPRFTSFLVLTVIGLALVTFLVFERRTFCRYLCPLTALIGTVGATGMVAGMRTRDRERCLTCPTKDCLRGSERGYPCPWYEWPGSATSNLMCGLCTECLKNCPYDNVGLFVQPPLTSVIAPVRRRTDIAWAVALLFGLVLFQQVNALPAYAALDGWLNGVTHFPGYPNPIDFGGIVAAVVLLIAAVGWGLRRVFAAPGGNPDAGGAWRRGAFSPWFTALGYGLIPLMGADYLARQLPRFLLHAPRIVAAISDPFARGWNLFGTAHSSLYGTHLASGWGLVAGQLLVTGLGTLAAAYATWRIAGRDLAPLTARAAGLRVTSTLLVVACGVGVGALYVVMGGAQ